jgi:hypothetical protein
MRRLCVFGEACMLSGRAMLLVGLEPEQYYGHWRVGVRVRLVTTPPAVSYIQSNRQTQGHREALIHRLDIPRGSDRVLLYGARERLGYGPRICGRSDGGRSD